MALQTRPLLEVLLEREVIFLDHNRYQTPKTAERLKSRGLISYWDFNKSTGKIHFLKHNGEYFEYAPDDQVFGINDIWYSAVSQPTKPKHAVNALYPYSHFRPMRAEDWYQIHCHGNVIFDMHVILHARGFESQGKRGQSDRGAMVQLVDMDADPAIGLEASRHLVVMGTNERISVIDHGEEHYRTGRLTSEGPFLNLVIPAGQTVWAAGRRLVFSDLELARSLADTGFGIVGKVPQSYPEYQNADETPEDKIILTKYEREFVRRLRERVDERDRRISSRTLGVIEEEVVQVLRDMPIQPDSPERIPFE